MIFIVGFRTSNKKIIRKSEDFGFVSIIDLMFIYQQNDSKFELLSKLLMKYLLTWN